MSKSRTNYQKDYWQSYKKRKVRIYGVLLPQDHQHIQSVAEQNGNSVWSQIWQESCAYRKQQPILPKHIETELRDLKIEIRRIGNNINQIAHQSNSFARLLEERQLLKNLKHLESRLEKAIKNIKP